MEKKLVKLGRNQRYCKCIHSVRIYKGNNEFWKEIFKQTKSLWKSM